MRGGSPPRPPTLAPPRRAAVDRPGLSFASYRYIVEYVDRRYKENERCANEAPAEATEDAATGTVAAGVGGGAVTSAR